MSFSTGLRRVAAIDHNKLVSLKSALIDSL